jgi:hypothetical protein
VTVQLLGREAPSAQQFVISWLMPTPFGDNSVTPDADHIGTKRTDDDPLPFRMAVQITTGNDLFSEYPIVSVHDFALKDADAEAGARLTQQRILWLAENDVDVILPDGTLANCCDAWTMPSFGPSKQKYYDTDIYRWVARYGFEFTLTANPLHA